VTAEINVFSVFVSDEADVMSSGRLFHSFGPAEADERSPLATGEDGRKLTTEVDSETARKRRTTVDQTGTEAQYREQLSVDNDRQFKLNSFGSTDVKYRSNRTVLECSRLAREAAMENVGA